MKILSKILMIIKIAVFYPFVSKLFEGRPMPY